jgi:hypothetical protein
MRRFQRQPRQYSKAGLAGLEAKRNGADAGVPNRDDSKCIP